MMGHPYKNDSFKNMGSYGNNVYVLLEIDDPPVNIYTRTYNLALYEIRQDIGFTNKKILMGSEGLQDHALDLQVTYKGIYILARIGSYFCQDNYCSSVD